MSLETIAADIARILDGEWRGAAGARWFVVERAFQPDSFYGSRTVGELGERISEGMPSARMLNGGRDVRAPLTFFDLETTGLNGGAGTLAFLVGCGWFEGSGTFRTRQYLLLDHEPSMLLALARDVDDVGTLVSFNGKSFDVPLLEMRYLFHRLPWFGDERPHLDVLHPSRRFWRSGEGIEGECSLTMLERKVLGVNRTGDVPGFEIPGRYFRFVRTGEVRPLAAVLEHNRRDLLSLAGLTARLLQLAAEGHRVVQDAREALALGRLYARAHLEPQACEAFQWALSLKGSSSSLKVEALRGLAETRRRERHHDRRPHAGRSCSSSQSARITSRTRPRARWLFITSTGFAIFSLPGRSRFGALEANRARRKRTRFSIGWLDSRER